MTDQFPRANSQNPQCCVGEKADGSKMPLHDRTTWLHGDRFHCLQPAAAAGRTWRIVLLGPPGVGKGTQAELLSDVLGACPLSTGDIFRVAQERQSGLSEVREANAHVIRGELVPDDIVLRLIGERRRCLRCEAGFLLDGFPRTLAQASALDGLLAAERLGLDVVIEYQLSSPELVARLSGRRVCLRCQAPFHVVNRPPRRPGICDRCGGSLVVRPDDELAAVETRLRAYLEATAQVAEYYDRQNLLIRVSARGRPETILVETLDQLRTRGFEVPVASAFAR